MADYTHPLFPTWQAMISRCHNANDKSFPNYGGRGVFVCESWRSSFSNFLSDMGEKPDPDLTIERVDVNASYSKDNCKWATRLEQANNKRNNYIIAADGKTQSLSDWARERDILPHTIRARIEDHGWTTRQALGFDPAPIREAKPYGPRDADKITYTNMQTYKGRTQSLTQWAREVGMSHATLSKRLSSGMTIDQALETPFEVSKGTLGKQNNERADAARYEHNGQSMTLLAWSRVTGISKSTLKKRVARGLPMSEVLKA